MSEQVEMIGSVKLILDDYPGTDLYSDGEVEDELLAIAKDTKKEDYENVIAQRKSWPVLYHFSPIRENILAWYPFRGDEKVLEIGAGCGAITGILSEKCGSVTCVELSKKRSLINAYRSRERGNIEIRLGNYQDIEKKLDTDFDVITLIGVFEYGSNYIDSEDPYLDFLRTIRNHLRPGGIVFIAIENRLGLKYFAGCTEDHTGRYFDGLEGYPNVTYAHTFSKPALSSVIGKAGFSECRFYYPYPDYKLPMSIYSDDRLPQKGELRSNLVNFDRERMVLFDETRVYDSLIEDGLFPLFSNSFLVVAKGGGV